MGGIAGQALAETAPAKVNLALHVTGRRADGYHELESLVVFAGIGDELLARPTHGDDRLKVSGPFAGALGSGETNLVMAAVARFRARWPEHVATGLVFELTKNLPVAAGLGGGSADAAAALRLMARAGGAGIPLAGLADVARSLGADVPACLLSQPAEIRGIGELVRPLPAFPPVHLVLANPLQPVVTAEVFRRLERRTNPPLPPLPQPFTRPAQLGLWLAGTRNDLTAPATAIAPVINDLEARLARLDGCMLARMSGSGATVFGLFGSEAQAHQAAHELRDRYPGFWVAAAPVLEAQ